MAIVEVNESRVRVTTLGSCDEAVYKARTDGALLRSRARFSVIDLYAGAGGLTLGFSSLMGHCFEPVWANDINERAARTYNANFGDHCVVGDIVDIPNSPDAVIPTADVVVGGPYLTSELRYIMRATLE